MKLFIVEGHTGEYSDRSSWVVAACLTRESAEKLEADCSEWAKAVGMKGRGRILLESDIRGKIQIAIRNGWLPDAPDQNLECDYTGVDYVVVEVPLRFPNTEEAEHFVDALIAEAACR